MSQDLMQALSGSSMMSLSVGTLPAVKSGMMLDANPFASQLALMTGPEGALGASGDAVSGPGAGSFAMALAGQDAAVGAPQADAVVSPDILALPEDASPSQIIEAVLKGAITPAPSATPVPPAGPTPSAQAAAAGLEQLAPRALPEAVDPSELTGETHSGHPRRTGKPGAAVASAADAIPLAAPFTPPVTPETVRPDAIAPENGFARTAISAQPNIASEAAAGASTGEPAPAPAAASAAAPAAPGEMVQSAPTEVSGREMVQSAQLQASGQMTGQASGPSARPATPAQRSIEAASRSARPGQATAALFDLADAMAQPVSSAHRSATLGSVSSEAVPPSWAAALNAVVPPVTGQSLQDLAAPLAAGPAEAAPLETLAFDADFVGSVETQIARVIGGGQMVRMQISPEHLGRIDIEMLAGPERDHVRITTEHDAVRDTLVQSQVRLEQDLRNSSQRNADVTVELRQQSPGTQGGSPQQQRGQSGQDAGSARDALARQTAPDAQTESTPAQRRLRGNVRYA